MKPRGRGPDQRKRKPKDHQAAGPGRPLGSLNALPKGAVGAIKALRHRVPDGTPEALAEIADRCLEVVTDVLNGDLFEGGSTRLQAARFLRDEICGPIAQKVELHAGKGLADRLTRAMQRADADPD